MDALVVPPGTPAIFRRPGYSLRASSELTEDEAIEEEFSATFEGVLLDLNLRWVDPPGAIRRVENRLFQQGRLQGSGIRVPETLITTDLEDAVEFASGGRTVVKAIAGGTIEVNENVEVLFTTEFDASDARLVEAVANCPVFMQRLIEGESEYRAVTVGQRSFVYERKRGTGDPLDWREADPNGESFEACLENDVSVSSLTAARALAVNFSSQDWIRDFDGRLWMLDANPAGQWLFLPQAEPITEALVDFAVTP